MPFCNPYCEDCPEIDWSGTGQDIVELTLRRDYLLIKLQDLVDSKSAEDAETALTALNEALDDNKDAVYLQFLNQAGGLAIIHKILNREKDRPSPLVAAPLLYKFAKHGIGYVRSDSGNVIACARK